MRKCLFIDGPNGYRIPCLSTMKRGVKKCVLIVHGFGSSMESRISTVLSGLLPEVGVGTIALNLPGHGNHEREGDMLTVENCLSDIGAVERYVRDDYHDAEICYFGSSFGAYLTLLYISRGGFSGSSACLRCSAVRMADIFESMTPEGMMERLESEGSIVNASYRRPIKVTREFYHELRENDLFEKFSKNGMERILMIHGTADEVAPFKDAKEFSEKFGVALSPCEGGDHRFTTQDSELFVVSETADFILG